MEKESVIAYTVCTRGYDNVSPPPKDSEGVLWVLFTDGPPVEGFLNIPCAALNRKASRSVKMLPHKFLPAHYDWCIYFDACQTWRMSPLEMLKHIPTGSAWVGSRHPSAKNVWEHHAQVVRFGLDRPDDAAKTMSIYKGRGHELAFLPFTENNIIIRRNTEAVASCGEIWHELYNRLPSERDQMTLPMAFLESGVRPATLPFSGRCNVFYGGFLNHADNKRRMVSAKEGSGPVVVVTVSVGHDPVFEYTRPWMENFCNEHGYVFEVITEKGPHRSAHWTKFEAGRYFDAHDARAVLLLDSDILIKPNSPSPAELQPQSGVWAFNSMNLPYMVDCAERQMERFAQVAMREGQAIPTCPHYINSGVVLVWRDSKDFFAPLPFESPVSTARGNPLFDDQNMMNHRARGRYHELPRAFNFGHPARAGNMEAMREDRSIFFLHLNGADDKVRTVEEMLKWECFKTSTNTVRNEREENSQGETGD